MNFSDLLKEYIGQTVIINNMTERTLTAVNAEYLTLEGGNPQLRLTEYVPIEHIVRVIRADYSATNTHSLSLDLTYSAGDMARSGAGH